MKRNLKTLAPVLFAAMSIQVGCVKQQTVKVDPSLAPAATSAAQAAQAAQAVPAVSAASGKADQPAGASQTSLESPRGEAAAAQGATAGKEESIAKGLDKIYFDFDSASLSETARATLAANFDALKANPQGALRIEGHCDERGSDDYNIALSERRAQAAAKYLQSLGIPAERLSSIGYGEEKPAGPGKDEQAWAGNRRDEFIVIK